MAEAISELGSNASAVQPPTHSHHLFLADAELHPPPPCFMWSRRRRPLGVSVTANI